MTNDIEYHPSPELVTDKSGVVLHTNDAFNTLMAGDLAQLDHKNINDFFQSNDRSYLNTEIWPQLQRNGKIKEILLYLITTNQRCVPVMLNATKGEYDQQEAYFWTLFIIGETSRLESALLATRQHANQITQRLLERERFLQALTNAIPGPVSYWSRDLHCQFANRAILNWFDKKPNEVIGKSLLDLFGENTFNFNRPYIDGVLAGQPQEFKRSLPRLDGKIAHTIVNYIPDVDDKGEVQGFFAVVNDITEIKSAESEMRLASSFMQNTLEGVMVTDANGVIISVNPAYTKITGYSAEEAIGKNPRIVNSNNHDHGFFEQFWTELKSKGKWQGEIWNRRKSGDVYLTWQTITRIPGETEDSVRYVSVFNDMTERWHINESIRHLAFHDPLTDLPNRALMLERLGQLLSKTGREQRQLAVLFLDLDRFKYVNDNLGHDVGDALLKAVARRLQLQIRQTDTLARLGGDEFVILLDNPYSMIEVEHIAKRIITVIGQVFKLGANEANIGVSIGIATYPIGGSNASELLQNADAAMYAAKNAGRNTYRVFGERVEEQAQLDICEN
jgi:diguanylate cyclase (GGDEF)-like protein/PAS domain S-box-containing protein